MQAVHQVAQKLRRTTFPRSDLKSRANLLAVRFQEGKSDGTTAELGQSRPPSKLIHPLNRWCRVALEDGSFQFRMRRRGGRVEAATWYQQNSNAQRSNRDNPDQGRPVHSRLAFA